MRVFGGETKNPCLAERNLTMYYRFQNLPVNIYLIFRDIFTSPNWDKHKKSGTNRVAWPGGSTAFAAGVAVA